MAQTTFFGLTAYGAGTAYDKTTARPLLFHEIPDASFVTLFQKYALGQSELALALQVSSEINARAACRPQVFRHNCLCQVDGPNTLLTKDVVSLCQEAIGRKATVPEVNAVQTSVLVWLMLLLTCLHSTLQIILSSKFSPPYLLLPCCRCFDTETSATISLQTFLKSLAQLKALSASPQSSSSCVSYAKYNDNKLRHHRVEYDPQCSLSSPVTTQQVSSLLRDTSAGHAFRHI